MKVAHYISKYIESNDNLLWGYIGGFNADILNFFCENKKNHFILNYHEQASAFAINAYSILSGKTGVATASGAPSAINLVAGIANAYFDSNPCVFIVGSPHSLAIRKNKKIRQNAFEEIDIVETVSGITKYAVAIRNAEDIQYELEKSFYIANEGRPGPVLIDIPYDIAREDIDINQLKHFSPQEKGFSNIDITATIKLLGQSKKPVILVGGGCRKNSTRKKLKDLLDKVQIPVVASLCGLDAVSHDNPCFRGFIGHYGNRYANLTLANADCIIILGSRLDERQMGGWKTKLHPGVKVIRVDVDENEFGRKFNEALSIHSTIDIYLDLFVDNLDNKLTYKKWLEITSGWMKLFPSHDLTNKKLAANNFIYLLSNFLSKGCVICADVGQNQMSVAQSIKLDYARRLINSAGYGSMGFSLPAAIGAAYAVPKEMIVSINGDGGIQMNIQELHTIKRDNLPVNIIVLNNNCLGMIRKTQEKLFNGKSFVSVDGYSTPNFEKIAQAYGIDYLKINGIEDYDKVDSFLSKSSPRFIEVMLPTITENNPEPGEKLDSQNPKLSDELINRINSQCQF